MGKLTSIEGIGEAKARKFGKAGIRTTDKLLDVCATSRGRRQVSMDSGISEREILECANRVDLMRLRGVGEEYSDLLENAGVDTVPELARRNASNLHQQMQTVNSRRRLVRQLPSLNQVQNWIDQAKHLPRIIQY